MNAIVASLFITLALAGSALAEGASPATYFAWQNVVAALICLLFGAVVCFYGYRLFRTLIIVIGFVIGFMICYMILDAHAGLDEWANVLISIVPGILGAILLHMFYQIAVFTVGFLAGFLGMSTLVVGFLGTYISDDTWFEVTSYVVLIVIGIVCGILALKFEKLVLVFATAFIGSYGITVAIDYFIYVDDAEFATVVYSVFAGESVNFSTEWVAWLMLLVWVIICIVGFVFQHKMTRGYHASTASERVVIISPGSKV
eukprot:TRINITY_DN486_c0_g1_i1.p2 TRINITY_DN486_c0_g1~~TRINITY_DN486_c0_g1_i1.p2  ORF type:complete len:258 (-),score=118.84 TRINITY_DN486_c0_g1_i1:191-964(-)